jgi:hypothetical protein
MINSRFAPAVCVLVALALVPTIIHSYAGAVVDDGLRASALPERLAGLDSRVSDRSENWGQRRFESDDWVERVYTVEGREVTLTVVRSFDLKALYHHPELAVAYGSSFDRHRVEVFDRRPTIPVHVLDNSLNAAPLALYALHYGDRFIAEPIRFQIRTAGELLFSGRRAMTLFFTQSEVRFRTGDLSGQPVASILMAAIDEFLKQEPDLAR